MIKSKIIKILWVALIIITHIMSATTTANAANIGETKALERGKKGYYCVQKWDGSKWVYLTYNQTFYKDIDGKKYIAYCLSPGAPGVGYVSGEKETYNVNIKEILNNDVIWRVLKNGYPNKSISELNVETADDAYFATMQAINAILRGYTLEQAKELYSPGKFAINGENLEDIQRRGKKTLDAMYNLINIGLNGKETRAQFLEISIEKETEFKKENDEFYSQIFKVKSQSEISEFCIDKIQGLPKGSYICDLQGNQKQIFNNGEKFKVMVSKNNISSDVNGKISIRANQKNYPIYYGASEISGYQDYALCNNSYSEVYAEQEIYIQTNKSKLTIVKIDSEKKEPISGVKFQVTSTDGVSNTFITDKNGKIEIANQRPGTVIIKEIKTIKNYKLNSKEVKVELDYNEIKEVKIENELQKGNIKIVKIDKDNNNIKLSGVKFQLKDEKGKVIKEGVTNKNGELLFSDIVVGKYKIVEVETNEKYELLGKEIVVEVLDGKTYEAKIENELQKGNIKIVKIDKDNNNIKLSGVKFQLKDEKGKVIKEGVTNKNGELLFSDIVVGKYKIVEVETNKRYELLNKDTVVEVVGGKIQEVKIENELQKGSIKIIKTDKENNEIKLSGVKFQLKDEKNNIVNEGETDRNGELLFENLLVGEYVIVEVSTNEGYELLDKGVLVTVINRKVQEINIENKKREKIVEKEEKIEKVEKVIEKIENRKLPKTGSNDDSIYKNVGMYFILGICNSWLLVKKFD